MFKKSGKKEDKEQLVNKLNKHRKLLRNLLLLVSVFTVVIIGSTIQVGLRYSKENSEIKSEFGDKYNQDKIYMKVDIKTTRIESIEPNLIKTSVGNIATNKKPKATVVTIFKNLDGKYQLIEELYRSNELTYKTFEYVTNDFVAEKGSLVLSSEYDRVDYKIYLSKTLSLQKTKSIFTIELIFAVIITLFEIILLALFKIANNKVEDTKNKMHIDFQEDNEAETKQQAIKIERQGIGSVESDKKEMYERDAEDAILREGGQFTGRKE